MPAVILGLLSQENISMKEVSEKSHVPLSTLANAAKKTYRNMVNPSTKCFCKRIK